MKASKSLLLCLILLTVLLGVKGRDREEKGEEDDDDGETTEGDIVITTTRNESHASASAFASAGGASATANAETTFNSLTSVNGEPEDEDEEEEEENDDDDDDDKKPRRKSKARSRNQRDVEERVRDAILNANVDRVASLLSRINDTDMLGLGFTYPADLREENLIFTRNRTMDPDVVALKGMAKAALEGDLSEKLTEVFITAVYGLHFDESECFKPPKYTHTTHSRVETENRTVITSGYQRITNESGTFRIDNDPEVLNTVSEDTLFEETNVDFREVEATDAAEDDEDEVCYTRKEMKTIRKNLLEDFSNVDLMTSIVEGTPAAVSGRQRSLLVVGTPVETWLCSACWRKRFCNKNVYWCPQ